MNYSKNYTKLKKDKYTTIRRYPKGKVGQHKAEVIKGVFSHWVKIIKIERKTMIQIPTKFLLEDTDCTTRLEATTLIDSFYRKPINPYREKLYIYYLEKV